MKECKFEVFSKKVFKRNQKIASVRISRQFLKRFNKNAENLANFILNFYKNEKSREIQSDEIEVKPVKKKKFSSPSLTLK